MPKGVKPSCSLCYRKDCFGTYLTHAQSCDNVHVQSAMEWAASVHTLHMPKGGKTFVFKGLQKVLRQYYAQSFDNVRVHSATQWTASVHTLKYICPKHPKAVISFVFKVHNLHVPKAVITFVFKLLRNGLLRYILQNTYAQSCDNLPGQSATEWTASVQDQTTIENENTFCRFRVFAFPSFCAFPISVRL